MRYFRTRRDLGDHTETIMTTDTSWRSRRQHLARPPRATQEGKIGYILLWLLGIPIPILVVIFLLRGCT